MHKNTQTKSLAKRIRRRIAKWSQDIHGYFVMRRYWRNRLAAFERKARFIDRMRYFGSYQCYREFMDYQRWNR